jgi:transcriptional regulator with XRE-family HTH domain
MARPKPTDAEMQERQERAKKLKKFMKDRLFSEQRLAEVAGISRRTIQMIKSGSVTPHPDTLRKLKTIMQRHEANAGR